MKKSIYVLAVIALTFTACKNEQNKDGNNDDHSTEMHDNSDGHHDNENDKSIEEKRSIERSDDKNDTTSMMLDGYFQIKNGLVEDDKKAAAKGGESLLKAFSEFDMLTLTEAQHKEYMEIVENATEQAEHIVKSPIDHQREHFDVLSNDMNDLIALLGTDKTLYQDFCPMYNDGKGAYWLSETKEIKNPFYGSKMLKCGKVHKQIN